MINDNHVHESPIPEEYVALVQALAEDSSLRAWFASLAVMASNRRYSELGRLSVQFRQAGQESLSQAILALNDEQIYGGIREVVDSLSN